MQGYPGQAIAHPICFALLSLGGGAPTYPREAGAQQIIFTLPAGDAPRVNTSKLKGESFRLKYQHTKRVDL